MVRTSLLNFRTRGLSNLSNVSFLVCRGVVQNILFENFYTEGAAIGPDINQDSGDNGAS